MSTGDSMDPLPPGAPLVVLGAPDVPQSDHAMALVSTLPPMVLTFTCLDLVCLLCGRLAGTLMRQGRASEPRGPLLWQAAGLPTARWTVLTVGWRKLRCEQCGGGLTVDDVREVVTRRETTWHPDEERPRRGRPPRARDGDDER